MDRIEYSAGPDQRIVAYVSDDTGGSIDAQRLLEDAAADGAQLAFDGWHIVATAFLPLRQTGTAGNAFFQSGGQYTTKAAFVVTYRRS